MDQAFARIKEPVQPTARVFPAPGTNLARILTDPQYRAEFHAKLKRSNPFITALYKIGILPLFGASRNVMLLTTRGRKSGKLRSTPIGYFRIGGAVHLCSAWGKGTNWYKNMTASPNDIWIQIGLRRQAVQAQTIEEPAAVLRTIEDFVAESPSQAQSIFGWEPGRDRMDNADFSQVVERVLIVRFVEKNKERVRIST